MTVLNMELDPGSIGAVIAQLELIKEELGHSANEAADMLTKEGAMVAQSAFGGMASVSGSAVAGQGSIVASGRGAVFGEFGAGYDTMTDHPYAGRAGVPVYVGSYSEQNDGMFYWSDYAHPGSGYWFFGGKEYSRIPPRHGMLDAIEYIRENAADIVSGVIQL